MKDIEAAKLEIEGDAMLTSDSGVDPSSLVGVLRVDSTGGYKWRVLRLILRQGGALSL